MPLNMIRIAKGSRKRLQPGDVFAFRMRQDRLFRYGRVIRTDTNIGIDKGNTILVYIYKSCSPEKHLVPVLRKEDLLLPPLGINDTGWREGYFETMENRPLGTNDVLQVHCFKDPIGTKHRYVDADGNVLARRHEPCGFYALGGYGSVDLKASKALGFPEPTDDEPGDEIAEPDAIDGEAMVRLKRRDVEHCVIVQLSGSFAGPFTQPFDQLEARLVAAVERAAAGRCDGHEFGLDGGGARIYFYGADADRLAEALLPILRQAGFAKGSYLLKQYGEPGDAEERVPV